MKKRINPKLIDSENLELIMVLMKHGSELEVLEPISLRKKWRKKLRKT
jgi:predicted DNA-binding transcriptional regulator YafY